MNPLSAPGPCTTASLKPSLLPHFPRCLTPPCSPVPTGSLPCVRKPPPHTTELSEGPGGGGGAYSWDFLLRASTRLQPRPRNELTRGALWPGSHSPSVWRAKVGGVCPREGPVDVTVGTTGRRGAQSSFLCCSDVSARCISILPAGQAGHLGVPLALPCLSHPNGPTIDIYTELLPPPTGTAAAPVAAALNTWTTQWPPDRALAFLLGPP